MQEEPGMYGRDICNSLKFWDNKAIVDIYFMTNKEVLQNNEKFQTELIGIDANPTRQK